MLVMDTPISWHGNLSSILVVVRLNLHASVYACLCSIMSIVYTYVFALCVGVSYQKLIQWNQMKNRFVIYTNGISIIDLCVYQVMSWEDKENGDDKARTI